jgi:MoxR-like ATPase
MNKDNLIVIIPTEQDGVLLGITPEGNEVSSLTRPVMLKAALDAGQAVIYNCDTTRCSRMPLEEAMALYNSQPREVTINTMEAETELEANPVMALIHNTAKTKPEGLFIKDVKWKYLVRNIIRGRNILMTGPSGAGKSVSAKHAANAMGRPYFYFNLGATQDPRSTLIGNTHFNKEDGTVFAQALFIKAIQTPNAVILLDEISRAHPEAWNILMTVLDPEQKYVRLDEDKEALTIKVADGVSFIATANIGAEYTATRAMDRALLDRFTILEMDVLNDDEEYALLKQLYGKQVNLDELRIIADVAYQTRKEVLSEAPKISSAISTRLTKEMAELLADGFTLGEAAETCIYPFYDTEGGVDSERTYIKQIMQKYIGDTTNTNTPF